MTFKFAIWVLSLAWRQTARLSRWDDNAFFAQEPIRVMRNGDLVIDGSKYRLWGVRWPTDGTRCQQHLMNLLEWRKVYVMTAAAWGHPDRVRLVCGRGDLNKQLIRDGIAKKYSN